MNVSVPVIERPRDIDELSALSDPDKSAVPKLGIMGVDVDDSATKLLSDLRIASGVLVTARLESFTDSPLMTGDVIHAINTLSVRSLDGLHVLLDGLKADGKEIVLQVERGHQLMFVTTVIY